jgi:uncharacterized membrane-anchored protein
MRDETILTIVGIIAITVLEIVNALTMKIDGNILSAVVGAVVFLVTRQFYQYKAQKARKC